MVIDGCNWLTRYNPLIDWVLGSITFRPPSLGSSLPSTTSSARAAQLPQQKPSVSLEDPNPQNTTPRISMIGAAAFMRASKRPGTQCFSLHLSDSLLSAKSASISDEAPDLSRIPKEYHDYTDVFSKATTLALLPRTSLKIPTHKSAENFRKAGLRSSSSQRRYTSSLGT